MALDETARTEPLRRVCVFCGSSSGDGPVYLDQARALGRTLAERGLGLVYGGASVGLMGALADAVLDAGGEVTGVIPDRLVARELAHPRLTHLEVVHSMHERKQRMSDLADAFVALPGGFGTLDELFEITTWAQLGVHHKPIGLLDVEGYFQPLLAFVQHIIAQGFVPPTHAALFAVAAAPAALLDALACYESPIDPRRWIGLNQT